MRKFNFNIIWVLALSLGLTAFNEKASAWQSSLYPSNWQPGMKDQSGRFIHDFSFAGYHNGEVSIPTNPRGLTYNVYSGFGADPSGRYDSRD